MINKKKVAAVMAVEMYFLEEAPKESKKLTWTESRPGWANQPRNNWTKLK